MEKQDDVEEKPKSVLNTSLSMLLARKIVIKTKKQKMIQDRSIKIKKNFEKHSPSKEYARVISPPATVRPIVLDPVNKHDKMKIIHFPPKLPPPVKVKEVEKSNRRKQSLSSVPTPAMELVELKFPMEETQEISTDQIKSNKKANQSGNKEETPTTKILRILLKEPPEESDLQPKSSKMELMKKNEDPLNTVSSKLIRPNPRKFRRIEPKAILCPNEEKEEEKNMALPNPPLPPQVLTKPKPINKLTYNEVFENSAMKFTEKKKTIKFGAAKERMVNLPSSIKECINVIPKEKVTDDAEVATTSTHSNELNQQEDLIDEKSIKDMPLEESIDMDEEMFEVMETEEHKLPSLKKKKPVIKVPYRIPQDLLDSETGDKAVAVPSEEEDESDMEEQDDYFFEPVIDDMPQPKPPTTGISTFPLRPEVNCTLIENIAFYRVIAAHLMKRQNLSPIDFEKTDADELINVYRSLKE